MKIREVITERKDAAKVGNDSASIARTAKGAAQKFLDADKGDSPISHDEVRHLLAHVRDMYGVELVDDFLDVMELPNNVDSTDKQMGMFSKDMRKKAVAEAVSRELLTESIIQDLKDKIFDEDGSVKPVEAIKGFWRESDGVMRGMILGLVGTLALMGGVINYAVQQAQYEQALHQAFVEYSESRGYSNMAYQEDFENYLAVRELAMETKTITVTEPVTTFVNGKPHTTIQTRAKAVPKYPEKVAELAIIKERMKNTYSIEVKE